RRDFGGFESTGSGAGHGEVHGCARGRAAHPQERHGAGRTLTASVARRRVTGGVVHAPHPPGEGGDRLGPPARAGPASVSYLSTPSGGRSAPHTSWRKPMAQDTELRRHKRGGIYFDDFVVGHLYEHPLTRTVTQMDNMLFSNMTLNPQPLHIDRHFCEQE